MGFIPTRSESPSPFASAGVAILGGAQVSLTLLEKMMDGVPFPFVKGAVGTAIEIIKIARTMHSNKFDCNDLLQRSTSLLVVILSSFDKKKEADIPSHLKREVERLTTTFHEVLIELGTIDRRSKRPIIGVAYYIDNTEKLRGCVAKLDWAMQEFQVTSKVESCLKDLERHEELIKGQTKILDAVEKVQKAMENVSIELRSSVMPVNPKLFGRREYVEKAVKLILSSDAARLVILGPGGMGKTSVALNIVHDTRIVDRFGKHCHWVPCEQAVSLSLLIELVAKSLGLPASSSNDRFSDIVMSLESSTIPHLFLLDNFETPWDIEGQQSDVAGFLARFGSISTVSFILTMRGNQHPASDLIEWSTPRLPSLDQLKLDAAREAFLRIAPDAASDPQLDSLMNELDCMPLAITLMAKLGEAGDSPSELLSQWKSESTGLLDRAGGDRSNSIEVSIKLSLQSNLVKHCTEAIPLLSILAKLPAGTLLDLLPQLCPSIPNWEKGLRILRAAALIYDSTDKSSVNVLSPIRSFIKKHHPLSADALEDIRSTYYKLTQNGDASPGDSDFLESAKQLAKVEANMEAVLLDALQNSDEVNEAAIKAALNYSTYLYWTQPQENIAVIAVNVTRTFHRHLLADCLQLHGDILLIWSNKKAAIPIFQEARSEFLAFDRHLGAAQCLQQIGDCLVMTAQYDEAESALKEARYEFFAVDSPFGAAQCLRSLGDILRGRSDYDAAQSALEKAKSEFSAISHPLGMAQCLRSIGQLFSAKGDYNAARSAHEEARSIFIAVGDPLGTAQCQHSLGEILLYEGHLDAAEPVVAEARSQFIVIGCRMDAAHCLASLGRIFLKRSEYTSANSAHQEARSEFIAVGNPVAAAQTLAYIGCVSRMEGRYADALNELEKARVELKLIEFHQQEWVDWIGKEIKLVHKAQTSLRQEIPVDPASS